MENKNFLEQYIKQATERATLRARIATPKPGYGLSQRRDRDIYSVFEELRLIRQKEKELRARAAHEEEIAEAEKRRQDLETELRRLQIEQSRQLAYEYDRGYGY